MPQPDYATTQVGVTVTMDVLANDSDPDGDRLLLTGLSTSEFGRVRIESGKVSFKPPIGFTGSVQFNYYVQDPYGESSTGTVTVQVNRHMSFIPLTLK